VFWLASLPEANAVRIPFGRILKRPNRKQYGFFFGLAERFDADNCDHICGYRIEVDREGTEERSSCVIADVTTMSDLFR
jgi:hypothetical protein